MCVCLSVWLSQERSRSLIHSRSRVVCVYVCLSVCHKRETGLSYKVDPAWCVHMSVCLSVCHKRETGLSYEVDPSRCIFDAGTCWWPLNSLKHCSQLQSATALWPMLLYSLTAEPNPSSGRGTFEGYILFGAEKCPRVDILSDSQEAVCGCAAWDLM